MNAWHWHPEVAVGLEALTLLYLLGVGPLRRQRRWGPRPPVGQVAAFLGGVLVLAGALLGPLAELAEHVALSAHMAQHLLLVLVVPPLWLLGTPAWLLRPLRHLPGVGPLGFQLTRPLAAFCLGSAALVLWHVPFLYDAALRSVPVHVTEHLTLLASAVLLWWPIVGPLPEWPRPPSLAQLLYLFLCTIPMTIAAAPITLAEEPLYPFYAASGRTWLLPPRADQEAAGLLMWLGGTVGYLVAGTIVFFRWAAREEESGEEIPGRGAGRGVDTPPAAGPTAWPAASTSVR